MTPLLKVHSISKAFGGLRALQDVSFALGAAQIMGVLGPNGAGKTTLFNCISGFHRPDGGTVELQGTRIEKLAPHQICRAGVARTFQIMRPFHDMTVLENIMVGAMVRYPRVADARRKAQRVLEKLGMADLVDRSTSSLGVADLRAIEVARAVATEPLVLLLDEMLAGLTSQEAEQMHSRFKQLQAEGLGLLVIEHSVPTMRALCEKVTVLNFGAVIADGSPDDVLSDPLVREAWLGPAHE